jgi:hypothetical protein
MVPIVIPLPHRLGACDPQKHDVEFRSSSCLGLEAVLVMETAQDRHRDNSMPRWDSMVDSVREDAVGWIRNARS